MRKIKWFIKQLFPLTYRSHYEENGKKMFCVWGMFLGKVFNCETYEIVRR